MLLRPHSVPEWPSLEFERSLWRDGCARVAGIDEVGRGPLAGPVVTAAVMFDQTGADRWIGTLTDSKQMTAEHRERAYGELVTSGVTFGIGACSSEEIDEIGIAVATRLAMARAIEALEVDLDHILIDAVQLDSQRTPQTAIIKGDAISLSIAAASVIAKVTRDRLMAGVFEEQFPAYGFASHKGYGTAAHLAALQQHGPCAIHRRSFRPVRDALGTAL